MNSKAQAWFMDFAIALLLFTFTLVVYFSYTNNLQKQEKGELDVLITDAKAISSSLTLSGYPVNWNNETVLRIGIADDQKVNATKFKLYKQINYSKTKNLFGTVYDYFVFFVNDKGEVLNINGICGTGSPLINLSYSIKSAYYYQDAADSFLKNFMENTFNADIYFNDNTNDIHGLHGFIKNLSKYRLIVMEHPLMNGGDYNDYYGKLNNYTAEGGIFIISGELTTSNGRDLNGIEFWKKSGQSPAQRTAIVNNTEQYLTLSVGQSIVFNQYYYTTNDTSLTIENDPEDDDYNPYPAADFKIIATYNNTNDNAIAKWMYGNGTVYFFSDFDVSFFNGDFVSVVEEAAKSLIEGTCTPINVTQISPKKLVKTERYVNYNSKIIKMTVYVWE